MMVSGVLVDCLSQKGALAMQRTMGGNPEQCFVSKLGWAVAITLLFGLVVTGPAAIGEAQSANLDGSWSGGGSVSFASGAKEQARCRAHYRRRTSNSYTLRAVCATASARAEQTATVRQVGSNRYEGSFYNSEYNVSGTIHIVVRGNSQNVRLSSSAGWAHFRLSR
jgi:hypothetical protein